jgi:CBS domain-containing protein
MQPGGDGAIAPLSPGLAVGEDVPRRKERPVKVSEAMTGEVLCCAADATLNDAAHLMWERDCGFVPVTERESGRLVGVVTDRDICMAAYTQGRPLHEVPVATAMSRQVISIKAEDDVARAFELLRRHQLHRLPVIDARGQLVGVMSLTDLARTAGRKHAPENDQLRTKIGATLAEVGRPRALASTG